MEKLTKLLYRKKILENQMNRLGEGAEVHSNYHDLLVESLKEGEGVLSPLLVAERKEKISEVKLKAQNFITSFKECKREYEDYLIPQVEEAVKEAKDSPEIEFEDCEKKAEELAQYELYGATSKEPDNVEHIRIIQDMKERIELEEELVNARSEAIEVETDRLKKAELRMNLFSGRLSLMNLKKRLSLREDYYTNQFLPKYEVELAEAEKNVDRLLGIAKDMVKLGIDPKLQYMLQEWEEHKDQSEKLWLFYTSLKTRLSRIAKHMRSNRKDFKGKMHLADKKLYI